MFWVYFGQPLSLVSAVLRLPDNGFRFCTHNSNYLNELLRFTLLKIGLKLAYDTVQRATRSQFIRLEISSPNHNPSLSPNLNRTFALILKPRVLTADTLNTQRVKFSGHEHRGRRDQFQPITAHNSSSAHVWPVLRYDWPGVFIFTSGHGVSYFNFSDDAHKNLEKEQKFLETLFLETRTLLFQRSQSRRARGWMRRFAVLYADCGALHTIVRNPIAKGCREYVVKYYPSISVD